MERSARTEPVRRPAEDAASIAALVTAACERERAGQSYGEAGRALRASIDALRRRLPGEHARGDIAAGRFSAAIEAAARALFEAASLAHPGPARRMSLVAVGGFGRGLLAPHSDVDLLLLHAGEDASVKAVVDFVLYPLWDAGLKVSQSVHTPQGAAAFARADMNARTSFLDARLIAGAAAPFADFRARYETLRKQTKKQFSAAKDLEREERHQRSDQTRFLAEPDVKEGKGGLRDIHAMRWIYKYGAGLEIDGARSPFSAADVSAFRRAERFLWSVRVHLHDLRGRPDDKLTFDVQPALAERLGYASRGDATPAERLMRHYFVNAMEIGRLTRVFSTRMEAEAQRLSPQALRILPRSLERDEAGERANLALRGGRLAFKSPARARTHPIDMFRLFRAFSRSPDFDFHPDALAIVAANAARVTSEVRSDAAAARLFLASLVEAKDPLKLLRVMAETGLLGRYIPPFGKIIGRIEYGLYRRFSIDESVFQSIGVLSAIAAGAERARHPIATAILAAAPRKEPYFVAALLHETAWAMRDADEATVERAITRVAARLGLSEEDAALAGWCAARHRLLAETAERRNLTEPAEIARFAAAVGAQARLDLLLVLGVIHYRVVGAYTWDEWTRRRIADLYQRASACLEGGEAAVARLIEKRAGEARAAAEARLAAWPAGDRARILNSMPDAIMRSAEPDFIARLADLMRAAAAEGAGAAVSARIHEGLIEAIVYAEDRPGLLADLAGAVAAAGASVRSVQAATTADGRAVDVFVIGSADGTPAADAEAVRKLHARLLSAAKTRPAAPPAFQRRIGDRRSIFDVAARVSVEPGASDSPLIIETEGRDRPGLLYDLCAALAALDASIVSAHIATYGARAVDAFYVCDTKGGPIAGTARIEAIRARLLEALADGKAARTPLTNGR